MCCFVVAAAMVLLLLIDLTVHTNCLGILAEMYQKNLTC